MNTTAPTTLHKEILTNVGIQQLVITDSPQLRAPSSPNHEFLVKLHNETKDLGLKL